MPEYIIFKDGSAKINGYEVWVRFDSHGKSKLNYSSFRNHPHHSTTTEPNRKHMNTLNQVSAGYTKFNPSPDSISEEVQAKESRIAQEANNLSKSISYLHDLISVLESKIQPVLSNGQIHVEVPQGNAIDKAPEYSEVSATFISLRQSADAAAIRLNELLDRIEL